MLTPELNKKCFEAVEILREYEPEEGYFCAFSGGKDSMVIYDLLKKSGCKFEAVFTFTTVDPPELLSFIRKTYPDVVWLRPKKTMFQLIVANGFPSRLNRWCCKYLKEYAGENRLVITGIRKQESSKRAKRSMFEQDFNIPSKRFIHLILEWKDYEVWDYIHHFELPYCELYDQGFKRIGCIGCPMGSKKERLALLNRYPNYKKAYLWGISLKIPKMRSDNKLKGRTPEEIYAWWLSDKSVAEFFKEK